MNFRIKIDKKFNYLFNNKNELFTKYMIEFDVFN